MNGFQRSKFFIPSDYNMFCNDIDTYIEYEHLTYNHLTYNLEENGFCYDSLNELFLNSSNIFSNYAITDILSENVIIKYVQQIQGMLYQKTNNINIISTEIIDYWFDKELIIYIVNELNVLYPSIKMKKFLNIPFKTIYYDITWLCSNYFKHKNQNFNYDDSSLTSLYIDIIIAVIHFWCKYMKKKKRKKNNTDLREIVIFEESIINKYIEINKTDQQMIDEWNNISQEMDEKFDSNIRNSRNCISNYVINKKHINNNWLKLNESTEITIDQQNKFKLNHYLFKINANNLKYEYYKIIHEHNKNKTVKDEQKKYDDKIKRICNDWLNHKYYDDNMISLHRINFDETKISLKCPNCRCFLQCIPIKEDSIAFICYNFPKCQYPLISKDYLLKYVWNNVKYVGPMIDLFDDTKQTKESELASFGYNEREYQSFKLHQKRQWKKLQIRNKYKEDVTKHLNHKFINEENKNLKDFAKDLMKKSINNIVKIRKFIQQKVPLEQRINTIQNKIFHGNKPCKIEMLLLLDCHKKKQLVSKNNTTLNKWITKYSIKQNYDNLIRDVVLEHMLSIPICIDNDLFSN